MRIGIYDPYLDTLGGGERYILSAALCLSKNHQVDVFWQDDSLIRKAGQKFNLDLSGIKTAPDIFSKKTSFFKRLSNSSKYDCIIFLSDGSLPWLMANKNIILIQFPVNWVSGKSLLNRLKLKRIFKIICYTDFVKNFLDKTFATDSYVLYPPVESFGISGRKENIILSVGRFTKSMNAKKQEILIDTFIKMYESGLKDWKLVLIGSYLPQDKEFVELLKSKINKYPIEIIDNASFSVLKSYYQKAKIYWHAAGFDEDLIKSPERAEHFGISTVEAMGAGCVPVVINAGGQKEIVTNGKNGYLWDTLTELVSLTSKIIKDEKTWANLSENARSRSSDFNMEKFCKNLNKLIEK
jgi:glycosyltransferase involved in cell wall biosynthesis